MKFSMRVIIVILLALLVSLHSAESFQCGLPSLLYSKCETRAKGKGIFLIRLKSGDDDQCECCCNAEDTDNSSCCNALVELSRSASCSSIPIHTSRRKFVHYTMATLGFTSFATSKDVGAETINDANDLLDRRNIIAVPGPLPPFSTTRTYRNIVLSNGLKVVLVKDLLAPRSSVAMSIDGAGQFAEPNEIPGLAHLMEHIVLSSTRGRGKKVLERKARKIWNNGSNANRVTMGKDTSVDGSNSGEEDFEDWLTENDGDSNAFTAPGFVCFHFNSPHDVLPEALERFSRLFTLDEVESTVQKPNVIPREIGRVADELDTTSDASRAFYHLKNSINPDHPFARFSAGSRRTLQTIPTEEGIDIASELLRFFRDHYLSSKATLVVIGRDDLSALDRWISPFSNVMSQKVERQKSLSDTSFPDPMLGSNVGSKMHTIILRSKDDVQVDENYQTLCIEWPLQLLYYDIPKTSSTQSLITAPVLGFVLTQIISRRGPGSLRLFLEKLGWVPKGSSKGIPRISFPVDVSGFQILRMEIGITLDGFSNRSAVVNAVFESIRKVIEQPLQLDLIKQYLTAAVLHGYLLAPRPPDAITLAVDSLRFGLGGNNGIGNEDYNWYLVPSPEDEESVQRMREVVTDTLHTMSDERVPLVTFRASPKAVFSYSGGIIDESISTPPLFLPWQIEPITGSRYYVEKQATGVSSYLKAQQWFASTFEGEELSKPYLNPLVPINIRAPRPIIQRQATSWRGSRYFYLDDASAYDGQLVRSSSSRNKLKLAKQSTWQELQTSGFSVRESNWKLWHLPPGKQGFVGLPLPVRPPEPSVEGAFVVQLLSSLPNTWSSKELTLANLYLLSFDDEILDLAELGATAAIAYETSINTAGLRLSFRGVSQSLPSYVRRFCRRFVKHHSNILDGSTKISPTVYERAFAEVSRSPKISGIQRQQMIETINQVSEINVAKQGQLFLSCTNGGYLIAQGDILPNESNKLLEDLQYVFRDYGSADGFSVQPDLSSILYRPFWKPRSSSPCLLPGLSLISDSCGRIPR